MKERKERKERKREKFISIERHTHTQTQTYVHMAARDSINAPMIKPSAIIHNNNRRGGKRPAQGILVFAVIVMINGMGNGINQNGMEWNGMKRCSVVSNYI